MSADRLPTARGTHKGGQPRVAAFRLLGLLAHEELADVEARNRGHRLRTTVCCATRRCRQVVKPVANLQRRDAKLTVSCHALGAMADNTSERRPLPGQTPWRCTPVGRRCPPRTR
eukprot:2133037-Prymnesium_polylepis.2